MTNFLGTLPDGEQFRYKREQRGWRGLLSNRTMSTVHKIAQAGFGAGTNDLYDRYFKCHTLVPIAI
jgi:hypothetical protein